MLMAAFFDERSHGSSDEKRTPEHRSPRVSRRITLEATHGTGGASCIQYHAAAPREGPGRPGLLPHTPGARGGSGVVCAPGGARRGRARRDTDPQSALLVRSLAWASTSAYRSE